MGQADNIARPDRAKDAEEGCSYRHVFLMYKTSRLVVLMYLRNTLQHRTGAKRRAAPDERRARPVVRRARAPRGRGRARPYALLYGTPEVGTSAERHILHTSS